MYDKQPICSIKGKEDFLKIKSRFHEEKKKRQQNKDASIERFERIAVHGFFSR